MDTYLEFLWHSSWKPIELLLDDLLWELDIGKETMHIHKSLWAWNGNIPKQHYCWVYIEIMLLICWNFHFKESFNFLNGKDMKLKCILTCENKTMHFNLGFHNWIVCRVKERWWIYNGQTFNPNSQSISFGSYSASHLGNSLMERSSCNILQFMLM